MKKTLLSFLLGASLIFGAGNKLKAQDAGYSFVNKDQDDFYEEKIGWKKEVFNGALTGLTIIYYNDKDNDNFHENIRVFNCNNIKKLITEDFFINKETGEINWSWSICSMNSAKWNKTYASKTLLEIAKEDYQYKKNCKTGYHPYLTKENLENIGAANRIKRLINVGASKNIEELKILAEEQRIYAKTTLLK